jgi:regulator of nucleoside diphosphate kinase
MEKKIKMQVQTKLLITDDDARQLRTMLERPELFSERDRVQCEALEEEIERAKVVPTGQIPLDVVTMHSRVRIADLRTGEQLVYQIVYPHEANYAAKKISILAPIGMALLGYSAGTEIDWTVPSGTRRLRIEAVEHRPKSTRKQAVA